MIPLAAERGFSFADPVAIGLIFCGVAVFAAIGALSHEHERAFSASIIYLGLGALAAVVIQLAGVDWIDPLADQSLIERLTELAVIIALFGTGLKLDRPLNRESWGGVARLLVFAMPLTIGAVALFGTQVMGLSVGAAIVLGAMLAPTDPVLAGDIGVGPPGDENEHEPNFSITGEAGLNDGLALPFLFLGLFVADEGGSDWLGEWLFADVLYAIGVAVAIGAAIGYGTGALAVRLRDRNLLARAFDPWLAIPTVLVIYGVTEVAGAYGFVAAFVGGVAFRRYEHGHEHNKRIHEGAESVEKFGELAVVLVVGSMLTLDGLAEPGLSGWLLVPVLLLAIRPLAVAASMLRSRTPASERAFVGWFGVRGIGSLYYAAIAVGAGVLAPDEIVTVVWTVIVCVGVSLVVHGVTAAPLARRWLPPEALDPGISRR
ncbi:MAG: cation:proton antiporter [Solirubrobacterales bacterium]|nr:cation:proton antiporter [Solirubrobacterales bacterium]